MKETSILNYAAFYLVLLMATISCQTNDKDQLPKQPNILFAIADDATFKHFGVYGTDWIDTPNFDRVADQGILFTNAYTPNAKCAPSRATILTGRNSWQLEEAANHWAYFPQKFKAYPEVLAGREYFVGSTGKGWAPGIAQNNEGQPRHLAGRPFNERELSAPTPSISGNDYAGNFKSFLDKHPSDRPFAFWYGGHEPHRGYERKSGINKGDMKKTQITNVPGFLADNDTVRTDLLDYGFEIEYFDKHLGRMLDLLEERGKLQNTLVVVTADNGMPFPRAKGKEYEYSNHMPMAIMWPEGIRNSGRKVTDFVSFIDLAPTFLEAAGINPKNNGMQSITGHSLVDIFQTSESGRIDPNRDYVLIGKERYDVGRPHDQGYPIRGIVTDNYLYLHNFEPDRWPAGNPETGYPNTDKSPTKTWILDNRTDPKYANFWQKSFGRRPDEELYDMSGDPANTVNLMAQQENSEAYRDVKNRLQEKLFNRLKTQGDPRMFGNGPVFDEYPYANKADRDFYGRYMNGELNKSDAGWVAPSDFEDKDFGIND